MKIVLTYSSHASDILCTSRIIITSLEGKWTDLLNPAYTNDISSETRAEVSARVASRSPSKFPILDDNSKIMPLQRNMGTTDRTVVATLNANGAWYEVVLETSRTECVASEIGPSLGETWVR